MIRSAADSEHSPDHEPSLLRVLEEVVARRRRGEIVSDNEVIGSHPALMPQLGQMLASIRMAEGSRRIAWSSNAAAGTDEHFHSDSDRRAERDIFPGYQLGEVIGRGASGVVYHAIQLSTGREVAIKVLQQGAFENEREDARFEREAQILAQLRHPNIVTVYDTGWSHGRFFLVMDFVRGCGLDSWLRSSPTIDARLRVFAEIAEATHAAHLRGVIHRDLKPGNIRIDEQGHPHLLDFGLAKVLSVGNGDSAETPPAYAHTTTMTGQFVGSLPWASPEQAEGATNQIDIRTDIYSIGVMMYQALTGQFPYDVRGNLRDVIDRIFTAAPVRMRSLHPGIDEDAETIVLTCLQKERERRYQSAGDLATDIRNRLAGEPIAARRASGWYALRTALRRHRIAVAAIVGVAALTIVYAATMSVLFRRAAQDADRARLTLSFLQDTLFQASSHRLGSDATMSQVLDDASDRLWNEFALQPEVAAALHYTVGAAYDSIWQERKAARHLRRAVELGRGSHLATNLDTLRSLTALGAVLAKLRNWECDAILREALEIGNRAPTGKGALIAEIRGSLAYAQWAVAVPPRWDEAEYLYVQSLEGFAENSNPENPELIRTMIGMASMQRARNHSKKAEEQYRAACERALRFLGPTHQYTLECQIALSDVLVDLSKFEEAQELIDSVSPLAERQFGSRIMPTILRRTVYAQIASREFETAEKTLFDIQADVCDRLAGEHANDSEALQMLAESLRAKVGKRGADDAFLAALDATQTLESDTLESARALVALGTIRFRQERYAYAERVLRRCLASLDEVRSPEYSIRSRASRMLAMSLTAQGRDSEAEEVLEGALAILQHALGPKESVTLQIADDLRVLYLRAGRHEDAAALPTRPES